MLGTTEWLHKLWPLERYSAPQSKLVSLMLLSMISEVGWKVSECVGTCYLYVRVIVGSNNVLWASKSWLNSIKESGEIRTVRSYGYLSLYNW
jgi:hypothetical protein